MTSQIDGCAILDTTLAVIKISGDNTYRQREGDEVQAPKMPAILHLRDDEFILWKSADKRFHLMPVGDLVVPQAVLHYTIHNRQKIAIGNTYWVVDVVDGQPVLRDC